MLILLSILIGFSASFVSGLFGGGAGLVTVPSIYWILVKYYPEASHHMQVTFGTGCFLAVALGVVASWRQLHYKNIDVATLKRCLLPILVGSLLGVILIDYLHSQTLRYVFSVILFCVGIWMWQFKVVPGKEWSLSAYCYFTVALLVGLVSAVLGVSVFTVPFFVKSGLDIRKAIGTATVVTFSYSLFTSAWFVYLGLNEVNLPGPTWGFVSSPILLWAIVPGVLASFIAVKCVNILPATVIKALFVGLMFVVSILMLLPH